jgi:predicted DNA-binding transcriptional regulator AlpA
MEPTVALYLTEENTSKRINVSRSALRKWRRQGAGPRYVKLGRLVRYSVAELENWLAANLAGGGAGQEAHR